jgi:hypothetical protein
MRRQIDDVPSIDWESCGGTALTPLRAEPGIGVRTDRVDQQSAVR